MTLMIHYTRRIRKSHDKFLNDGEIRRFSNKNRPIRIDIPKKTDMILVENFKALSRVAEGPAQ